MVWCTTIVTPPRLWRSCNSFVPMPSIPTIDIIHLVGLLKLVTDEHYQFAAQRLIGRCLKAEDCNTT